MRRHTDFQEDFSNPLYFDEADSPKRGPNIWQRLSRVMEVLIYLLGFFAVGKMFWPEVQKQELLNGDLSRLDAVVEERQQQVALLRQDYQLLKNDREYLETVARDRLNLMRGDEYVIRIQRTGEE